MKKCYRYCAGPAYYRMCSTDVYCSKQTGSSSTKELTIISFLGGTERKLSMQPKFVAAQKIQNRNPANIRKWIARFITLGIYTPLEARVYCSQ